MSALKRIRVSCDCGARLNAPAGAAGSEIACPRCERPIPVPGCAIAEPIGASSAGRAVGPPPEGARACFRWALVLSLLPLVVYVFNVEDDKTDRFEETLAAHPELVEKMKAMESVEEFFDALPEHKIAGALHSRGTWAHWLYATLAAGAFFAYILLGYPIGRSTPLELWKVGLSVGTIGIFLLLTVQTIASWTEGWIVTGRSILVVFFWIAKFIGYSYRAAMDPENGFVLSMIGFTCGVGLCEELCKAIPLVFHHRRKATLDLQGAVAWGLAAGAAFGVSEGIMYSSDTYNGVMTGDIYVVRFVSCVALHAVWTATCGILIFRMRENFLQIHEREDWIRLGVATLSISVILHGLYDTLLKREMSGWALLTAVVSFAWFLGLYEWARRDQAEAPELPDESSSEDFEQIAHGSSPIAEEAPVPALATSAVGAVDDSAGA